MNKKVSIRLANPELFHSCYPFYCRKPRNVEEEDRKQGKRIVFYKFDFFSVTEENKN